jgi:hypothetical protein
MAGIKTNLKDLGKSFEKLKASLNQKQNTMQTFQFYVDKKVVSWEREFHEIEADSFEEALEELEGMCDEPDETRGSSSCTQTVPLPAFDSYCLKPENDGGNPTVQIFNEETDELLWENAPSTESQS